MATLAHDTKMVSVEAVNPEIFQVGDIMQTHIMVPLKKKIIVLGWPRLAQASPHSILLAQPYLYLERNFITAVFTKKKTLIDKYDTLARLA